MENKPKTTIKVAKILATILGSRDLIDNLKKAVSETDTESVDLDFSEVEFVSRSAAHALLIMKEDLRRKFMHKKEVYFVNANKDIETMLRIVAANRALPKEKSLDFKAEKVDIKSFISLL